LSAAPPFETRSVHRAHGGAQGFYTHDSAACAGPMRVGVYLPPAALRGERVPAVYFLAGLTCTDETFAMKAGAQRLASELGLCLVTPDTSPRATRLPGDDAGWDFGLGAGFYLDATEAPWSAAYQMERYVVEELPAWVEAHFPVRRDARSVMGHSMGGHGALTLALRNPGRYASVSAFAPIVAPCEVPWGQKAFAGYLGPRSAAWEEHDACQLVGRRTFPGELLIDQGLDDKFLARELQPERFEAACAAAGQHLTLRRHHGYDHSYYFIASFVEDHLRHHARALRG
jgi:S-formylglutathione hydrolase